MNAWSKVLDQRSFETNLPWDKAGGDSLNALRLWFLIEEALGISLPLDALDLSATPEELVAAVKAHTETATELGVPDHQRLPVVFFMPPHEGDDFGLAQLRAVFEGKIRFFVARYPSWRELARTSDGFADIARTVAAQVICASDESDIFLAGYSFGGFVAWEVARELRKAGRQIRFIGLIDTRRRTILQQRPGALRRVLQRSHFLFARPRHMHTTVFIWLIRALLRMSARRAIGAMGSWASYLPPAAAFTCQSIITSELRLHALRHWEPKPLNVPVSLFRSGEAIELAPDFGWGALTDQLDVVNVGGTHLFIFESPYREIFSARFADALATARALIVGGSETQRAVALAK
jgi:thioesterase domain-containing protein/acyl carrier protein